MKFVKPLFWKSKNITSTLLYPLSLIVLTINVLKEFNASIGITTEPRVALINKDNPLTLPRLDTNDFPQ